MYVNNIDYPACHSMDTEWFAIDKNGNVAVMNSDEDGALPLPCDIQMGMIDFLYKNTEKLSDLVYKLNISKEAVEQILFLCESLTSIITEDSSFWGFIKLREGTIFEDLEIVKDLSTFIYDSYVLLISDDLYFIPEYNRVLTDILIKDINSGRIVSSFMPDDILFDNTAIPERSFYALLGFYHYESDAYGIYYKKVTPKYPIKITQFAKQNLLSNIDEIEFSETNAFNPMQYVSCRTYGLPPGNTLEHMRMGYPAIYISKDEIRLARISNEYLLQNEYSPSACKRCESNVSFYEYLDYRMRCDYPKVLVLSDYQKQYRAFEELDLSALDVKYECIYNTYAIKCIKKNIQPSLTTLIYRFSNCFYILEKELTMLHIQLIICHSSNATIDILKSKYMISENNETGICDIEINGKIYPLVFWTKSVSENVELLNTLNRILSADRQLPSFPRVLPTP